LRWHGRVQQISSWKEEYFTEEKILFCREMRDQVYIFPNLLDMHYTLKEEKDMEETGGKSGRRPITMTGSHLIVEKREEILRICAKYGARNVRVFGSFARGEADEHSDIDLLVEMKPGRSLLDLGGLQYELEELLGRQVDVVTEPGLKARIRERVLKETVPL